MFLFQKYLDANLRQYRTMEQFKKLLRRLGPNILTKLYGQEAAESISGVQGGRLNTNALCDMIIARHGHQALAVRDIRLALYARLTPSEQGYILDGEMVNDRRLSAEDLAELASQKWGRKMKSSQRAIHVFSLDESFLPAEKKTLPSKLLVEPKVFLYPHQQRLKDTFVRAMNSGTSRVLLHMPTGAGKTRTSIEGIIDYWKASADRSKNIIWLAHSEELCEQAVETFVKLWEVRGDRDIKVSRFWGDHQLPDASGGNSFIVTGLQKLHAMLSSSDNKAFRAANQLKTGTALIVIDEAHKAIAPTYRFAIDYLFNEGGTKLIGLTATPGRQSDDVEELGDTETDELVSFFEGNKLGLTDDAGQPVPDPISYLQEKQFLSKIRRRKITTDIELELNDQERKFIADFMDLPKSVLNKLAVNDERNALIAGEVAALALKDRQIILFALSIKHAHTMTDILTMRGIRARCIDGNTPPSERASSINEFKQNKIQVLVNYGVLTTGFDAPNTNAVVIARPTSSVVLYSQMIGRGIRGPKVGGNAVCDLVDLEDNLIGFPSEQNAFNYFNQAWSK